MEFKDSAATPCVSEGRRKKIYDYVEGSAFRHYSVLTFQSWLVVSELFSWSGRQTFWWLLTLPIFRPVVVGFQLFGVLSPVIFPISLVNKPCQASNPTVLLEVFRPPFSVLLVERPMVALLFRFILKLPGIVVQSQPSGDILMSAA